MENITKLIAKSDLINELVAEAHNNALDKGFYDVDRGAARPAEQVALIHAEVSELLENIRNPIPEKSSKMPEYLAEEEEAADIIIRVMDMAGHRKWRLGQAILAKLAYNRTRSYKHGKKF